MELKKVVNILFVVIFVYFNFAIICDYKNINYNHIIYDEKADKRPTENSTKAERQWKMFNSLKFLCELLDEYCKFGSLHGLRYIRDLSIPTIERLFWLYIFLICLCIGGILLRNAYLTGFTNEFQLVLNPKSSPISDIPFPAVLVCSAYPIRKSVFDLEKEKNNVKFKHFSKMVCSNKIAFGADVFNDTIDEEFFEFISNASIPCRDLIVNCHWNGRKRDCCTLFKPIITLNGLCYVFNSLPGEVIYRDYTQLPGVEAVYDNDLVFWDIDSGYPNRRGRQGKRVRPYWVELGGSMSSFTFDLVDFREERQEICSGPYSGFQLYIYSPNGVFEPEAYIRVPFDVHTYIKLKPSFISSEEDLRGVDIDERACLFKDEFQLEYFNHYSQSACQIECFTKMSLRQCGCVPFNVQRFAGVYSFPSCNDKSISCLWSVYDNISRSLMSESKKKLSALRECVCVPACSMLHFHFRTSFHKIINLNSATPWFMSYNKTPQNTLARLSFFYGGNQFNSMKRIKTSDLVDNLANCGGLLGLLLGFSFMSFFELIYFSIIRPVRKMITLLIVMVKNK